MLKDAIPDAATVEARAVWDVFRDFASIQVEGLNHAAQ